MTAEGVDDDKPETDIIAVPRALAESANWPHTPSANPKASWHVLLPLDGVTHR